MANEIGIYRGSFDPPHYGHFEAVDFALKSGMSQVSIIYKDINLHKPFRCDNKVRKELLKAMFAGMPQILLSKRSYSATLADMLADPSITKVYQIIGSDILNTPVRPVKDTGKLAYFIHLRNDYPIHTPLTSWNNLPVKTYASPALSEIQCSSSEIRALLFQRNFQSASLLLPPLVFEKILSLKAFFPSDDEYRHRVVIQEVKKTVEKEIVTKKLVPVDSFPLTFHLGSDIGISGLSGDLVCFIKDRQQQIVLVVKVFIGVDFEDHYASELLGYETLAKLNLTLVKVPELFFSHRKETFGFIGMSFIKGKSFAEVMCHTPAAIHLCAQANLELHLAQRSVPMAITPDHLVYYETFIESVFHKLGEHQAPMMTSETVSELVLYQSKIRDAFLTNPGPLSFTHGDPNHSNWIVDEDFESVTYIDLSLFKRSITAENTPKGFAICELEESLLTIWIAAKRLGNIPIDRIYEIQQKYKESYLASAPSDITTDEAQRYFSFYWSLRVVDSLLNKVNAAIYPEEKLKYETQLQNKIDSLMER